MSRARAAGLVAALALAVPFASRSRAPAVETAVVHGPGGTPLSTSAYPGTLPAVEQRTVTTRGALEPPLVFGADGSLFYASWTLGKNYPLDTETVLFRSTDEGGSWHDATPQVGGVRFNTKGGDPILYRDASTGRLFTLLYFGGCSHLAWTDDAGSSWDRAAAPICEPGGVTDYPKLWTSRPVGGGTTPAGAPFYTHLCYNGLYRLACQRSLDGGRTWAPSPSPDPESGPNYHNNGCWSFHANWTLSAPDGTIYMARPYCDDLEIAISRDNGLSWEREKVARFSAAYGTDFGSDVRLAMDDAGNLYYLWISRSWYIGDGYRPLLTVSRDGGETWSQPVDVGAPGITAAKLPSIVAGEAGRIAFLYVGSDVPGGWSASEEDMASSTWHAYVGFSLNALDPSPVFATTTVGAPGDPLRRGPCAGRCSPAETDCIIDCRIGSSTVGLYDYFELALDPVRGTVAASLVDLCTAACAVTPGSTEWSSVAAVGVQVGGASLRP